MIQKIRDNFSWIKDIAIVLGMCAVLYLNLNYVTNTKFEQFVNANEIRTDAIQSTITSLDKSLALLQQNNGILTTLQTDMLKMNAVLNDAVQQNKVDVKSDIEFHDTLPKIAIMEANLAQLMRLQLDAHIVNDAVKKSELDLRLKRVEQLMDSLHPKSAQNMMMDR